MQLTAHGIPSPRPRPAPAVHSPVAAQTLIDRLLPLIDVCYQPLHDTVARLDTTTPHWVLHLDSDSPAEDHCWVLLDVLTLLTGGANAATSATPTPRLCLVRDGRSSHHTTTVTTRGGS